MINNEFQALTTLQAYCQKVLPLVYDDSLSYLELLCKVLKKLNDLINNNNLLPDFILDLIKTYLSGEEFQKIMADLLSDLFLNVKYPPDGIIPAVGDGTKDDTVAIQGCIDYANKHGGMSIFIPSGSYLVQPLVIGEKTSLYGNDRYTTKIVLKGGSTKPLITGTAKEITIDGIQFNGNAQIQVNQVNLLDITVGSAIIGNCFLTDGNTLLNVIVNENLQLSDIIFKRAVIHGMVSNGPGFVQGDNLVFDSVSSLDGKDFITLGNNKSILEKVKCSGASPLAVNITGSNNVVRLWNEQSVKSYEDTGINNTVEVYTNTLSNKYSGNIKVSSANSTETVAGDKTVNTADYAVNTSGNLTESITLDKTVTVSGNSVENVIKNDTKTVNGNQTDTVLGIKSEILNAQNVSVKGNRTVIAGSEKTTVTGARSVNAESESLTVTGARTVSAMSQSVDIVNTLTENVTDRVFTAVNDTENVGKKTINATDISLNSTNPLTYKTPTKLDDTFKSVKFKDGLGTEYDVLVYDRKIQFPVDYANIVDYGAVPGGADCTEALKSAFASNKGTVYIPEGEWWLSSSITNTNKNVISDGTIVYKGTDKFAFVVTGNNIRWIGGTIACWSKNTTSDVYGILLALNYDFVAKTCEWGIQFTMEDVGMFAWEYAVVGMQNFNCRFERCNFNTGGAFYGLNYMNGTHVDSVYNGHTTFANCHFVESKRFPTETKERALVTLASPKEYYFDNVTFEICPWAVNIFRSDAPTLNNMFNLCHWETIGKTAFVSKPIPDPYNKPFDRAYAIQQNWSNQFCRSYPGRMSENNPFWVNTMEEVAWIENEGAAATFYYRDVVNKNTGTLPVYGKRAQWNGHYFPIERTFPDLSNFNTLRTNCKTLKLTTTAKTAVFDTFHLFDFDGTLNGALHEVDIRAYAYNASNSLYGVYEGCVFALNKGFLATVKEVKTLESIVDFSITAVPANDCLKITANLGNTYTNAIIFITGKVVGVMD